jgi:transposase
MKRKGTYHTQPVEQVRVSELLPMLVAGCIVALDVAKAKFVVAFATLAGEVVKLVHFEHPRQTTQFLRLVEELWSGLKTERDEGPKVRVVMEPTGTYGDAIRYQLQKAAAVEIRMLSPKKTHDATELFDGVPSMHDAKSATLIAKMCSLGMSKPWEPPSESARAMRALIDRRGHVTDARERCFGRLEALLSRHWPEFMRWLDLREQKSASTFLEVYSSPQHVTRNPEGASAFLRNASRGRLSQEAIDGVVADAAKSLGLPPLDEEVELISTLAAEVRETAALLDGLDDALKKTGAADEGFKHLASLTGAYTAAVLVTLANPLQSSSAAQFEKACGLNLREKSSGEHKGRLSLTKRGPSQVRQVLYLFALRLIAASPIVRAWYERRQSYSKSSKTKAVVAVMRKLTRALFHVARGNVFDAEKLFKLELLKIEQTNKPENAQRKIEPRTAPRPITSTRKRGRAQSARTPG